MEISTSCKLIRDEYSGFYSCGLTMMENGTMNRLSEREDTTEQTVMKSPDGLELKLLKEYDAESGTTSVTTVFTNNSSEMVTLEMLDTFVVTHVPGDRIHRFLSFWAAEGRHLVDDVKALGLEHAWNHMAYRVEKFGTVGTMPVRQYFPFLAIEDTKTGEFTAFELYSPSSWQMEIISRHDDTLTITGGIADRDFGHFTASLAPGEALTTPKAVICRGTSLYDVCHKLLMAQKPAISPLDDQMGITFNEYCTTWGDPTEENMIKLCDRLAGEGIQYLVMDSGWYIDGPGYWWDNTGNWDYSPKRFPHGLKFTADYIRSKGMIPGIWYEFETVGPLCPIYEQADLLLQKDGVPLSVNGRRFPDMENPKVREHLREKVIRNLADCGFGYIKVDYNDTIGIGCDGPDGLGENMRRKILATQSFFREMTEQVPGLVIENCSSGGHRLEPSMMALASMASFSDAHEIVSLPIIAASLTLLVRPEQNQIWAVLRKTDSDARMYFSLCATLFGRMGLSGDIYDMSEHQWNILREGMAFYRLAAPIIRNGMTTLIVSEPDSHNHPEGGQLLLRRCKDRTLAVYHRFENSFSIGEFMERHPECRFSFSEAEAHFGSADCDFSAESWIL